MVQLFIKKSLTPDLLVDYLSTGDWHALLDGVLIEDLPAKLAEADIPYYCLFSADLPYEYNRIAPYLVKLPAGGSGFFNGMMDTVKEHRASFLRYQGDDESITRRFQHMAHAELPDGRVGVLRFQDSRILNVLLNSLSPLQVPFVWPPGVEEYLLHAQENTFNSWYAPDNAEIRTQAITAPFMLSVKQLEDLGEDYHNRLLNQLVQHHKNSFDGPESELPTLLEKVVDEAMECGFVYPQQICDYVDKVSKIGWLHETMHDGFVAILRQRNMTAPMKLSQITT
jgi:hypothetical protein